VAPRDDPREPGDDTPGPVRGVSLRVPIVGVLAASIVIAAIVLGLTGGELPRAVALRPADRSASGVRAGAGAGAAGIASDTGPTTTRRIHDPVTGWSLTPAQIRRRDTDINAALSLMNAALVRHDGAAFAEVASPSFPSFADRQRAVYAALAGAPLSGVHYRWSGDWLDVPQAAARYGRPTVVAAVTREYTLGAGWDPSPVAERLGLTFVLDGPAWAPVSDQDAVAVRLPGGREPWDDGPVTTQRSGRVLVVGRGFGGGQLARLARRARQALAEAGNVWPAAAWNGKLIIYAVRDQTFLHTWFGSPVASAETKVGGDGEAPAEFEALVHDVFGPSAKGQRPVPAGSRLVVGPAVVTTGDDAHAIAVLRHEIGHLATRTGDSRAVPVWLAEGIADYVAWCPCRAGATADPARALERRGLPGEMWRVLREPGYRPRLASDEAFYAGDTARVARNYTDAWLTVLYIADHFGQRRLREFLRMASTTEPGHGTTDPGAASEAVLELTLDQLRDAVGAFARDLRDGFA
jgi:hypothetical protein